MLADEKRHGTPPLEEGPGSWFLVPGSWFLVPGSWFLSESVSIGNNVQRPPPIW
ncbi:hypothetical protein E4U41_007317 [Claviceps citrina]|nr:hypothetical protein E4U41_007317 [Claviceps citrina]